jgi:hypothetical protein
MDLALQLLPFAGVLGLYVAPFEVAQLALTSLFALSLPVFGRQGHEEPPFEIPWISSYLYQIAPKHRPIQGRSQAFFFEFSNPTCVVCLIKQEKTVVHWHKNPTHTPIKRKPGVL